MSSSEFIKETSNKPKLFVLFVNLVLFIIVLSAFLIAFNSHFNDNAVVSAVKDHFYTHVKNLTSEGIFYVGFVGGLFFVPIPQEIPYFYSLVKGNDIFLMTLLVNTGYLLAQIVNYLVGRQLNHFFIHAVSKKKVYSVRRFVNNYGAKGVLIFNILPLPAPLLTFGLGLARYNSKKLFFWTIVGTAVKYTAIILFFLVSTDIFL